MEAVEKRGEVCRIALIDSDPLACRCLQEYSIAQAPWAQITCIYNNGLDFVEDLSGSQEKTRNLDAIVVDDPLADCEAAFVCRRTRLADDSTPIVCMTLESNRQCAKTEMLNRSGAQLVIEKTEPGVVFKAVKKVVSATRHAPCEWESPGDASRRLRTESLDNPCFTPRMEAFFSLLLFTDLAPCQAASRLSISQSTARGYMKSLRDRYGCLDSFEALRSWACDKGLHRSISVTALTS